MVWPVRTQYTLLNDYWICKISFTGWLYQKKNFDQLARTRFTKWSTIEWSAYLTFSLVLITNIGWFSSLSTVVVDTKDLEDATEQDKAKHVITSIAPTKNAPHTFLSAHSFTVKCLLYAYWFLPECLNPHCATVLSAKAHTVHKLTDLLSPLLVQHVSFDSTAYRTMIGVPMCYLKRMELPCLLKTRKV